MQGCIVPSEVAGISTNDARIFGNIAEELIYADFCMNYTCFSPQVFCDHYNYYGYITFLAMNNPLFTKRMQKDFDFRLHSEKLMKIPDIIVHKPTEKAFYEIKPKSKSGLRAGIAKVGILNATYKFYDLPYTGGWIFWPKNHRLAYFGNLLKVTLQVERMAPGLIVYSLCIQANGIIELSTLAVILRFVIKQLNQQKGRGRIDPIDLEPLIAKNRQLEQVAKVLGLTMTSAVVAIGWKYFWQAVIKRFAVRASAATLLSAADGPLPVGELIATGLAIWTIIDIIRLSDQLWQDAAVLAKQPV